MIESAVCVCTVACKFGVGLPRAGLLRNCYVNKDLKTSVRKKETRLVDFWGERVQSKENAKALRTEGP